MLVVVFGLDVFGRVDAESCQKREKLGRDAVVEQRVFLALEHLLETPSQRTPK